MKKKILALVLCATMVLAMLTACSSKTSSSSENSSTSADASTSDATSEDASSQDDSSSDATYTEMNYEEFMAADVDTAVKLDIYVADKQKYNAEYGNTSIYAFDDNGFYFLYRVEMTQEEYDALEPGTEIIVSGYKAEWSGEVEVADASIEKGNGKKDVPAPVEIEAGKTADDLLAIQNALFAMKDLEVVESEYKDENDEVQKAPFLYSWDGSGEKGSDLYFNVTDGTTVFNLTVETDLCDSSSDVYAAVEGLKVGDKIDVTGFMYWYNGPNPHITSVTVK